MVDLYKSVADDAGLIKAPNPYDANVIRSFTEKGSLLQSVQASGLICSVFLFVYSFVLVLSS